MGYLLEEDVANWRVRIPEHLEPVFPLALPTNYLHQFTLVLNSTRRCESVQPS
jgi:hypothetical protein